MCEMKIVNVLAIIVLFTIVGCSNSTDRSEENNNKIKTGNSSFIGTIKEINGKVQLYLLKC